MQKGDSCIDCHMPGHKTVNISHLTQTDHRVLRIAGDAKDDAEPPAEGQLPEQLVFFDNADARLTPWERDRAVGLGAWVHLSNKGRERSPALGEFLRDVLRRGPVDGDLLTVLGAMALDQNRPQAAADYYRRAEGDPKSEESVLEGLLKIDYLSGHWDQALVSADRLLEIDPGNARVHAMRADSLGELGRGPEAIEAAERSLEFNPSLVPVRQWLANAYRLAGRTEDQQRQEDILRRMRDAPPNER
jgi:tetratricopeptide (TPR) repeat protein